MSAAQRTPGPRMPATTNAVPAAVHAIRAAVIADLVERFSCPADVIETAILRGGYICHEYQAAMNQAATAIHSALGAA